MNLFSVTRVMMEAVRMPNEECAVIDLFSRGLRLPVLHTFVYFACDLFCVRSQKQLINSNFSGNFVVTFDAQKR